MKNRHFILVLLILHLFLGCSEEKSIRIAAIQMNCKLGELDTNLAKAEKFIREAFEQNAEMVILPEFFTTPVFGFPYNDKILEAVCPLEGKPLLLLKKLSQEYNGIIGGSFLAFHGTEAYNSFVLIFPDGSTYVHNKDYPTVHENCYYAGGDDDGIFVTPIGNIGVALCWEYIRSGTARRLLDQVDIIIGGSCWPGENKTEYEGRSLSLLKSTLTKFPRLLGVPVVHANHVGEVRYFCKEDTTKNEKFLFLGETQIVNGYGDIIERLSYKDGEGIIISDVILGKIDSPTDSIPDNFWIPDLDESTINWWKESLTGDYRKYYEMTALPYYLKKWTNGK